MVVHVGIDIGTSSAKVCVRDEKLVIYETKQNYPTEDSETSRGIQNAKNVLKVTMDLLEKCHQYNPGEIWVCGQMHGIVLWNQQSLLFRKIDSLICSPLYNWTYSTPETSQFLETLPKWTSGEAHPGFGLVTLAQLFHSNPESLKPYTHCGTIMDLFLSFLTQSNVPMSHHNAHSWGYCTYETATWQSEILECLPEWIQLPTVTKDISTVVGTWQNANCHVASGDLQASVASLDQLEERIAYIILGTSAQLCCLVGINETPTVPPTVVQLPYSSTRKLLAGCSMNGGNALEAVLETHFPFDYSTEKLSKLLEELDEETQNIPPLLKIDPIFIPERGISKQLTIEGISSDTSELQILEATHLGIIRNLFDLFPIPLLKSLKIQKLSLVGSAQCPRFRRHIESEADFQLAIPASIISTPLGASQFQQLQ